MSPASSKLPPEVRELLNDPRLADMKDSPDKVIRSRRVLEPRDPPKPGESRYLLFREDNDDAFGLVSWENQPADVPLKTGRGQGFPSVTERPRIQESLKKPPTRAGLFCYRSWWVASAAVVETLRRFDAEAVDAVEIDWIFADGQRLERHSFVDVRRQIYAYDYARSSVIVEMENGEKKFAGLGHPRALKPDIDPAVHAFRDAYHRSDIFVSRALAKALSDAVPRGIRFEDPVSVATVTL